MYGIKHLCEFVDTLLVIPNSKLCEIYSTLALEDAFHQADNVLYEAAKAVSDIINVTGLINVDFADVKSIMQNMGYALIGSGLAEGDDRAINAARAAIDNPLLTHISLQGCQSLLLNITAGHDILMSEFDEVSNVIVSETGKAANIIMGIILDDSMAGKIRVTIIATGLDKEGKTHLIDFPGLPNIEETTEENVKIVKESDEEIKDIFARLNINKPATKEEPKQVTNETGRVPPLRTDVPSFFKGT